MFASALHYAVADDALSAADNSAITEWMTRTEGELVGDIGLERGSLDVALADNDAALAFATRRVELTELYDYLMDVAAAGTLATAHYIAQTHSVSRHVFIVVNDVRD